MLDLADDFPLTHEIAAIDVYTFPLALSLNNVKPPTTLGAKFSLPHMVAAALIYKTGGPRAFYQDTLSDPTVAKLREKVNLMPFDKSLTPPNDRPSKIVIKTYDGKIFEQECLSSQGGPDRPFSQDVVLNKINDLSAIDLPGLVHLAASFDMSQANRVGWKEIIKLIQEKPIHS